MMTLYIDYSEYQQQFCFIASYGLLGILNLFMVLQEPVWKIFLLAFMGY